jgi:hypothetical protein
MAKKQQFTLTEAATEIGCDKATVSRRARELEIGQKLGTVIVVTASEVRRLAKVITPRPASRKKNKP